MGLSSIEIGSEETPAWPLDSLVILHSQAQSFGFTASLATHVPPTRNICSRDRPDAIVNTSDSLPRLVMIATASITSIRDVSIPNECNLD
ncbi:hypothetical protein CUC08_Gglean003094 [Alternaria sp. MG1]|nr:hypothetical protein CUC08_Gglean003094 [Alternaria sp. MG1]